MKFVKEHTTKTLEVKQSKFIAHLVPISHYESTLKALQAEHPKARHFVVASRYINEFDQIVEHSSDDGEPKGTSGKPSLAVLAGHGLINTAVIIVRYFGGTKLGTGGLVRAYSDACNDVIEQSVLSPYKKLLSFVFEVSYSDISLIEYRLQEGKLELHKKEFNEHGAVFYVKTEELFWKEFYKDSQRLIKMKHTV